MPQSALATGLVDLTENVSRIGLDLLQNGQEALETFAGSPAGAYSIIFMDIQMPVMNGYEATRQIRVSEHECY